MEGGGVPWRGGGVPWRGEGGVPWRVVVAGTHLELLLELVEPVDRGEARLLLTGGGRREHDLLVPSEREARQGKAR